jgi:hypothetical protein
MLKIVEFMFYDESVDDIDGRSEVVDEEALRRRAESVAVESWRLVCSCMILRKVR